MTNASPDEHLARAFLTNHPAEAARVLDTLPDDLLLTFCESVPPSHLAPVLAFMDPLLAARVLTDTPLEVAAELVTLLPVNDACVLVRRLPDERRVSLLAALPDTVNQAIALCMSYPADQAGAQLDPTVLTLWTDQTVQHALDSIVRAGQHAPASLFVLDRFRMLSGVVDVRTLLAAAPETRVGGVARSQVARIGARADRAQILAHPAWTDSQTLPVVDGAGRFLGVLRYATLRRLEAGQPAQPEVEGALEVAIEMGQLGWSVGCVALDELSAVLAQRAAVARSKR